MWFYAFLSTMQDWMLSLLSFIFTPNNGCLCQLAWRGNLFGPKGTNSRSGKAVQDPKERERRSREASGLGSLIRVQFSIYTALATLQRVMNDTLAIAKLPLRPINLENVFLSSKTPLEQVGHVLWVLCQSSEVGATLNLRMYTFTTDTIYSLDQVIHPGELQIAVRPFDAKFNLKIAWIMMEVWSFHCICSSIRPFHRLFPNLTIIVYLHNQWLCQN